MIGEALLSGKCAQHHHGPCISKTCECICHIDGRYCHPGWCEHCAERLVGKCHCPCHKKA